MALVPAICTQCGAQIEVDNTHEAGICKHCGTAFITEKAINNYTTYVTNHNNFAGANVTVTNEHDAQWYYVHWLELWNTRFVGSNNLLYDFDVEFSKMYPTDYRRLYVNVIQLTNNFEPRKIKRVSMDYSDTPAYEMPYVYTQVTIGGLHNADKIRKILQLIIANNDGSEQSKNMINNIENHLKSFDEIEKEKMPGSLIGYDAQQITSVTIKQEPNPNYHPTTTRTDSTGCYIATCVYGSYDCPEVWTLRRFRDYTLDTTWYGKLFIKCYYAISPTIVKWFGETKWFKVFWKECLDKMVSKLNSNGVENTRYQDKY